MECTIRCTWHGDLGADHRETRSTLRYGSPALAFLRNSPFLRGVDERLRPFDGPAGHTVGHGRTFSSVGEVRPFACSQEDASRQVQAAMRQTARRRMHIQNRPNCDLIGVDDATLGPTPGWGLQVDRETMLRLSVPQYVLDHWFVLHSLRGR